jgi:CDGSH-type Zn-finger protein
MTRMTELNLNVRPNGPILCTGPLTITDTAGNEHSVPEGVGVALCRCGLSTEKPFCTGSHRNQFADETPITRTF